MRYLGLQAVCVVCVYKYMLQHIVQFWPTYVAVCVHAIVEALRSAQCRIFKSSFYAREVCVEYVYE